MDSYYDLGTYSRPITTSSPDAQTWFDRGLIWTYGFNHEATEACFKRALEYDPDCAMAHWGIGYVNGPFLNKIWENYAPRELSDSVPLCYDSARTARALAADGTPVEQALTAALCARYPTRSVESATTFETWTDGYANAMRAVYADHPTDQDVVALFAEAMMTRTPWKLWAMELNEPAVGADTVEIVEILERAMASGDGETPDPHPGIAHMYVHALEMSPYPERAFGAADQLREMSPDCGHLRHMPCHIDSLCGHYLEAVAASKNAIAADAIYLAEVGPHSFYTTACCHDLHMMMFAAMFLGHYGHASAATAAMTELLTVDVLDCDRPYLAGTLEGYYSMSIHVEVRFGRWQQIIDAPLPGPQRLYAVTTAMSHYAKSVANAALGDTRTARAEQALFEETRRLVPEHRIIFNNPAQQVLDVGASMIEGEIAYRERNFDEAWDHLWEAVRRDDELSYTEPWAWMHPPRHALGALLLEQDHVEEAAAVYRADLGMDNTIRRSCQHPGNVWSMRGYVECLDRLGHTGQAAELRPLLNVALLKADIDIASSCACSGHAF